MGATQKFLCQVAVHEVSLIRIFGNSIMYKMSFFSRMKFLNGSFFLSAKFCDFFFWVVSWIFFGVSLFYFAPWCVLVEKNQTPNAFSASGGLGYANLSWIVELLITLAYSSHTKEIDLSSLPPVCLLRNSVLGWQYKAKWNKKWNPALSKVREKEQGKKKHCLCFNQINCLLQFFDGCLSYCCILISGNKE